MNNVEQILSKLPQAIRQPINDLPKEMLESLEEIRIKAYSDIRVVVKNQELVVILGKDVEIDRQVIEEILNNLLNYSYYAYEEELAKGYITIEGGHRVGVCGRAVLSNGKVSLIKEISSLNLRRSREVIGVAERVMSHILNEGEINNTLIVSPPKCGKTTLLRDIVRVVSHKGFKVGLCDERSEIAGSYLGKPSYDLGPRTDVMDGCPKAEGMIMLIRAMSPQVVATDEIGKREDIEAIEAAICAGVKIITTMHGNSYEDVLRSNMGSIVKNGVFSKLIFLTNDPHTGSIGEIINV
ncbi:MAG: stage III sporulation protein AA [Anaerovoracaceae bacterium]